MDDNFLNDQSHHHPHPSPFSSLFNSPSLHSNPSLLSSHSSSNSISYPRPLPQSLPQPQSQPRPPILSVDPSDSALSLLLPLLVLLSSFFFLLLVFLIFLLYLRRRRSASSSPAFFSSPASSHSRYFSSFFSLPRAFSPSSAGHGRIRLRDSDGPLDLSLNHEEPLARASIRTLESNWLDSCSESTRVGYLRAQMFEAQYPPNSQPTDITLTQFLSIQEKGVSAWAFEPDYYMNPSLPILVQSRTEIHFMSDGFGVSQSEGGGVCVQSNLPLPKLNEVYYFECKMYEQPENSQIAIGLATKPYPSFRLPGWNRLSVGYFSSDGFKSHNYPFTATSYGPPLKQGDVLGVGYRPRTGSVFFTRNGKKLEDAYVGLNRYNLFPTIGSTGPAVVHVNLGQAGFVFIEANVKKWGLAPSSGTLAPPPAYGHQMGSILLASAQPQPTAGRPQQDSRSSQHSNARNQSSRSSSSNARRSPNRQRHRLVGYTNLNTSSALADQSLPHNPPTPRPLDISLEQMSRREPSRAQMDGQQDAVEVDDAGDDTEEGRSLNDEETVTERSATDDESRRGHGSTMHETPSSATQASAEDVRPPRYAAVDPYKYAAGVAEVMLFDQFQGSSNLLHQSPFPNSATTASSHSGQPIYRFTYEPSSGSSST